MSHQPAPSSSSSSAVHTTNDLDRQDFLVDSESSDIQEETEDECKPYFVDLRSLASKDLDQLRQTGLVHPQSTEVCLLQQKHYDYLSRAFGILSGGFVSLDASRPWMLYWTLHGVDLLGRLPPSETMVGIVHALGECWQSVPVMKSVVDQDDPVLQGSQSTTAGGFGGGFMQLAHCATTYAAVLALCIIATSDDAQASHLALEQLRKRRIPLYLWFLTLQCQQTGGFRMHLDGEIDIRATYCMLASARLLDIASPKLISSLTLKFLQACQSYEGGFGGEPGNEAHGGYTFCGLGAIWMLRQVDSIDTSALLGWLTRRQMAYEGGFQGRSNKLVDGCYSFWQGGAVAILSGYKASVERESGNDEDPWLSGAAASSPMLFDEGMLQRYILLCAQDVNGGLRDKPSKSKDFYHSCYNLSGLSVSQNLGERLFGHAQSTVARTHPVYNIRTERVQQILDIDWNGGVSSD